jgi:predicted TIM-barrel fold metal-dependent hydrolase
MTATLDWVIDCDTHITEPGDLFTRRVARKHRDRAPRIVRNDDGVDVWRLGDSSPFVPVGHTAVAGWKEPFPAAPKNMDEVPKASYDGRARLEYMDSLAIWSMALYPNVGGFGNQAFLDLGDPELMLACVRAYNDFLLEWIEPDPKRFIPIMATPYWDVEASVREIERCAALGHKGVLFTGEPQKSGFPLLGDPHWHPLWAAAQDAGLPVSFHIGSGRFDEHFSADRLGTHGIAPTVVSSTVSLLVGNAHQVVDLLLSGILPRFPKLDFVTVESGIGWIPFLLEAADHCFGYAQVRRERPEFELLPSEYFHRQVHGCYFFEELAPQRLLDRIGVDNVLFETDYPHPVCLYGNVREKIDAGLEGQPEEVRRKVLFDNAARLYGVEAPAGPPPAAA